ncbi:MAG: hypothetical protein ACLFP0_10740 [Rhodosalinus sp.]
MKIAAVAFARAATRAGVKRCEIAAALGLSSRTLRDWQQQWDRHRMRLTPRGRPAEPSPVQMRNALIGLVVEMGLHIGAPTLQHLFPEMPRREIASILGRIKDLARKGKRLLGRYLKWTRCGAVWAVDHKKPPGLIDGVYPFLLVVRDLASHRTLLSQGVESKDAPTTNMLLEWLMRTHGAPLVLKADNGFAAASTHALCNKYGVTLFLSPPKTPEYNGAVESGIGWLATRITHFAARAGRVGWSSEDCQAAMLQANECLRPWGPKHPSPDEVWAGRQPITMEERLRFQQTLQQQEETTRAEEGWLPGMPLPASDAAGIRRKAIQRATVACGFLLIRRKPITVPIPRLKTAWIA